jgi:hypothetical protein
MENKNCCSVILPLPETAGQPADSSALREYCHQTLGEDYGGIAGYYTPVKEVRLEYQGREILYIVGRAVIESSCCGAGNWPYALVPGYIVEWHKGARQNGLDVTGVELVRDPEVKKDLLSLIRRREELDCITFW